MPMNTLRTALLALVVAAAFRAAAQPVYTFRVNLEKNFVKTMYTIQ